MRSPLAKCFAKLPIFATNNISPSLSPLLPQIGRFLATFLRTDRITVVVVFD